MAYHPGMAFELVKYHTMLFCQYPASACILYDQLFRRAASHDPSLRWDVVKEDMYVWSLACQPRTAPSRSCCSPGRASPLLPWDPPMASSQRASRDLQQPFWETPSTPFETNQPPSPPALGCHHDSLTRSRTRPPVGRFAAGTTSGSVPKGTGASSHTSVGPRPATGPGSPAELLRAPTPLRWFQFEKELRQHQTGLGFFSLLQGISKGIDIGYMGPGTPTAARNLCSSIQHPQSDSCQTI